MNYWHLQLHPNDTRNYTNEDILEIVKNGIIGIDIEQSMIVNFDKSFGEWSDLKIEEYANLYAKNRGKNNSNWDKVILNFRDNIQIGDIVLVRNGDSPIALVEVSSDYYFEPKTNDLLWFRHRRKIKLLQNYKEYISKFPKNEFQPQVMGTLTKVDAINLKAETNKGIIDWYSRIKKQIVN